MGFWNRNKDSRGPDRYWTSNEMRRDMAAMGLVPSDSARDMFGWSEADDIDAAITQIRRLERRISEARVSSCTLREEVELQIQIESMRNLIRQSGGVPPEIGVISYQLVPRSSEATQSADIPLISSSASSVSDPDLDLVSIAQKCHLMIPKFGMELPNDFLIDLTKEEKEGLRRGLQVGITPQASECIRRFSYIESNTEDANLKGLGRVTSASFPRLGGVLFGEVRNQAGISDQIAEAVQLTMNAGYLAMLCFTSLGTKPALVTNADELWERWIPRSYSSSDQVNDLIFDSVAITDFWHLALSRIGFTQSAALMKSESKNLVVDSIGGLATTGATLFLAERAY